MPTEEQLKRIIITGPPCAGKSTIVETFRKEFYENIQCIPEIATMLITELKITPEMKESSIVLTREFGHTLYYVQQSLEKLSEKIAKRNGKKALLLDKSCLDVAVHFLSIGKTIEEYEKDFNTTISEDYKKSDLVLFLELPKKETYDNIKKNNFARRETYEEAKRIGEIYYFVWKNHPKFSYIENNSSWEDNLDNVRKTLRAFLKI